MKDLSLILPPPNFAGKHPSLPGLDSDRDTDSGNGIPPSHDTLPGKWQALDSIPAHEDIPGVPQYPGVQDGHPCPTEGNDSPTQSTDTSFLQIAVECNLLSSASRPQSHPAYAALGHDCIRLLRILPALSTTVIRCRLEEFSLCRAPAYTALSYTWGSPHGTHQIYVNDHQLSVPKNLWRFLRHARGLAKDLSGWIWCDMLSINQVDLAERGHQVKLMSRIFKTAETVVVWLGPAYRGSDTAMTALARLPHGKQLAKQAFNIWAGDAGHAMGGICRRPYWRRLWVFQEIRLAQKIRLMCGSKTAPWKRFHDLMEHALAKSGISRLDDNIEVVANSPAMRMRNLNLESVDTVLWSLVQETRHLRCFDIRDKIYALLGVATKGHESIEPDYSIPIPSLVNRLLHEIWSDSPPETLKGAAEWCANIEDVLGVERGTAFIIQGQRGSYKAPSLADMRSCRLGPKSSKFTLWWTSFYGHSSVQTLLRKAWHASYFDGDPNEQSYAPSNTAFMSTPVVVSLFQLLRKDMDSRSSFLGCSFLGLEDEVSGLQDVHIRVKTEDPEIDGAEAMDTDVSMAWVTFYLTDAVDRNDGHVTRLMLEIGVGCDLLYTQYRSMDTLIQATAGALRSVVDRKDGTLLETMFARAGPFISDTHLFVAKILDHGRMLNKCSLLLDLGLIVMVPSDQRAVLLNVALSKALRKKNDEAVEALLSTGECDPNRFLLGRRALSHCMYTSQESNFRALLNTGKCDLNLANPSNALSPSDGMTPLMQAALGGLSAYARALLGTGECRLDDANARDGMTPLFYAASRGHTGVVRELLDNGCNVDTPHPTGKTALEMAKVGHHKETVKLLSSHRSSLDDGGDTALMSAAAKGHHRLTRNLLKFTNCNVNLTNQLGNTPLALAVIGGHVKVVKELLACERCDVNASGDSGDTAFGIAITKGNTAVIREFLACERCNVNKVGEFGRTALIAALRDSEWSLASEILDCGRCDVNIPDYFGMTPLMTPLILAAAFSPDDYSIVDALLTTEGCDVNAEDKSGWTALIHAGHRGKARHVESLLRAGKCNIDQPLQNGSHTVLHMAAALENSFLPGLLRQHGLSLRARDNLDHTPLMIAGKNRRPRNVRLLLGYGAGCGVNMRSILGHTALGYAVSNRDYETVCLLVNSGRVKDINDETGKPLSSTARERGYTDIERVLLELAAKLRMA